MRGMFELIEIEEKKIYIKNSQQIEDILIKKNISFYKLYEFISKENIIIDENFDVKKEYEGLYPHALLKPTQSGLDLQAIAFEAGDNSTDAKCEVLEYRFCINEKGLIDMIYSDDGDGIENHDIKKAVAYGGYFGPKDVNKSGKFMEGLSNICGSAAGVVDIYTSNGNGQGWYKSRINFNKLKNMVKIYEESVIKLIDIKKEVYRGIAYKYIANSYIQEPTKTSIGSIRSILNDKIVMKEKGTIIVFKNCNTDIIDASSFDEDIKNLKEVLGRRYWKDIDNGIEIYVVKDGTKERVKSIDFMMRSEKCNYRNAFNTRYFELEKIFKVSDFTEKEEDNDYLSLNVSIKEKTHLYTDKILKRPKKNTVDKILVPKLLSIGIGHQGLSVERNNRPISDNVQCGLTRHNNYNGISVEICVDSRMDDVLFVTGDKSSLSERKLNRVFGKKLDFILSQAYKVKCNKQKIISYENADGEYVEVCPSIIRYESLTEDEGKTDIKNNAIDILKGNIVDENIENSKNNVANKGIDIVENNVDECIITKNTNEFSNLQLVNNSNWVSGLVFASKYKPACRYDSHSNIMLYERNDYLYLVFDDTIDEKEGIRNKHLQQWWARNANISMTLEERIMQAIPEKSIYQKIIFSTYKNKIEPILKENTPALLVEVELYHNSYTNKENKNSEPQRMDFCLVLPNNKKVLIEIDGIQHIGEKDKDGKWIASEEKYAKQCKFDNEWVLKGNEIYRISNKIFKDMKTEERAAFIENFFILLFKKHNIIK